MTGDELAFEVLFVERAFSLEFEKGGGREGGKGLRTKPLEDHSVPRIRSRLNSLHGIVASLFMKVSLLGNFIYLSPTLIRLLLRGRWPLTLKAPPVNALEEVADRKNGEVLSLHQNVQRFLQ